MANINESTVTVRKLMATQGYYLTQNILHEGEERVFTKVAFLSQDQPAGKWREASEGEKDEYEKQREIDIDSLA